MLSLLFASVVCTAPPERVLVAAICDDSIESAAIADRSAAQLAGRGWQVERSEGSMWQYRCAIDHKRALELLESGKVAFHNMRFKAARKQLKRAYKAFAATGWLGTPSEARDVLVYLGWIGLENRDAERGQNAFAEAVRLWPAWRPGEDQYPPHVVRAFAEAVVVAAAQPRGGLAVRTQPPGATVILNGHTELTSPCTFSDLFPGEHSLALRHPQLDTVSRTVAIEPGGVQELDVVLADERRDDWFRATADEDWQALRSLAPGADVVLLVVPAFAREGVVAGVVVKSDDAQVIEVAAGDFNAAAGRLVEAVTANSVAMEIPPPPEPAPESEPSDVLSSWWFWTAIAVVGAGAVAGATYAATRPDELTITVRR